MEARPHHSCPIRNPTRLASSYASVLVPLFVAAHHFRLMSTRFRLVGTRFARHRARFALGLGDRSYVHPKKKSRNRLLTEKALLDRQRSRVDLDVATIGAVADFYGERVASNGREPTTPRHGA